jgi:hypothetical protein
MDKKQIHGMTVDFSNLKTLDDLIQQLNEIRKGANQQRINRVLIEPKPDMKITFNFE